MDTDKIDNVVIEGIDTSDAPDFVDAYIVSADYDGVEMNEGELDKLNEDSGFVHQEVINLLF